MTTDSSTAGDSFLDRTGLETHTLLLLLFGVVLFFIPEPITSVIGVLVLLAGAASWLVGRLRG